MKQNLYLAFTPYHVFLASLVALEKPAEYNRLLIVGDFAAEYLATIINKTQLFEECVLLKGLYKLTTKRNTLRKNNARQISALIKEYGQQSALYLGTDTRLEGQAAAAAVRQQSASAEIAVLEDGGDFYNSADAGYKPKSFWHQLHSKLVLGRCYEDVKIAGLYSKTQAVYAIYPELLRIEVTNKACRPIHNQAIASDKYKSFLTAYWQGFTAEKKNILAADGIIMIAHSGYTKHFPGYAAAIRQLCQYAASRGMRLIAKYHPREEQPDYCQLAGLANVSFLAEQIPAELIYTLPEHRLQLIIGDISSALMTAKWLLKDRVSVYSIAPVLAMQDERLLGTFKKIGINVVDNVKQIKI